MNPAGSDLVYSTTMGGRGEDFGNGIAVDAAGNAYVVGTTGSCDFPLRTGGPTCQPPPGVVFFIPSEATLSPPFLYGVFVAKLNPAGSDVVYTARLGAGRSFADIGAAITLDSGGNVYITGRTDSAGLTEDCA